MTDTDTPRRKAEIRRIPPKHPAGAARPALETPEKDQAGSYARDAEQDPERERHGREDSDR